MRRIRCYAEYYLLNMVRVTCRKNYTAAWTPTVFYRPSFSRAVKSNYPQYNNNIEHYSTIYALSSGYGKCAIAVIRISGPQCRDVLTRIANFNSIPEPRRAFLRMLCDPTTKEPLDRGLVLWFPGPNSFTGEDCAELHIHGGPAVVGAVINALSCLPNLRAAMPGEFTKRAFFNGKMDLTEVEGLADLLSAESETQRRQALRQMSGDLSRLYAGWRERLLRCTANIEAFIDFSEDDNIDENIFDSVSDEVKALLGEIKHHLSDNRRGERLRSGVKIAILGETNVGKSSLLNLLCERPAAIVSPIPGTTRDVVEVALNIRGFPVVVSDTAGLRHTDDVIEREGVKRAIQRAQEADLKLILLDVATLKNQSSKVDKSKHDILIKHLEFLEHSVSNSESVDSGRENEDETVRKISLGGENSIIVFNKSDLIKTEELSDWLAVSKKKKVPTATLR